MDNQNSGYWILCSMCLVPYIAGFASAFLVITRLGQLGLWGLVPFGGTFKRYLDERQG